MQTLFHNWGSYIGLSDLLDIALVSFLIYRFFLIIQGTRAVQMLSGVSVLIIVYLSSIRYELFTLHWLLTHFFEFFFIILVILFQDQMKAALVTMGEASRWFQKRDSLAITAIEEVVMAVKVLSRERVGALIVFEKQHGLLNFSLTGTNLDCSIHSDILYSLFLSQSPLHDGAVIIKGNRIQAAGCFLPLSKNVEVDRHYGTRHRAALGLSEVSDALIVIVSEETGKVQLCYYGEFIPTDTIDDLRINLKQILRSNRPITDLPSGRNRVNLS